MTTRISYHMNIIFNASSVRFYHSALSRKVSLPLRDFDQAVFKSQRRRHSNVVKDNRRFRMAVIGSGPAGFYTAYKVMSRIENATVDMYEQLPVPYGLVRFGVAPDHPEVKNCEAKFAEVASSPRFNFIGNIDIGHDISLLSLRNHYDAILFAYGASKDRKLGISGEDSMKEIYSARAFVGWYNSLPEYANLKPNLEAGEEAVVIGQGNVALDVARILLSDVNNLRKTDISIDALDTLAKSKVKKVRVVGRRGPMQASFTIKEVRELVRLESVGFSPIDPDLFPPDLTKLPRVSRRMMELLQKGTSTAASQLKSWSLDFLLAPTSFKSSNANSDSLTAIDFMKTQLEGPNPFDASARVSKTNESVTHPASIAFRSIGYKSEALPGMEHLGIHFDKVHGIITNDQYGRVLLPPAEPEVSRTVPGLYCSGWVKSGPNGVIANTMEDAFATAESIALDWERKVPFLSGGQGWADLKVEATRKGLRYVSWDNWLRIDCAEKERGKLLAKEREKFRSIKEMLDVLE